MIHIQTYIYMRNQKDDSLAYIPGMKREDALVQMRNLNFMQTISTENNHKC